MKIYVVKTKVLGFPSKEYIKTSVIIIRSDYKTDIWRMIFIVKYMSSEAKSIRSADQSIVVLKIKLLRQTIYLCLYI